MRRQEHRRGEGPHSKRCRSWGREEPERRALTVLAECPPGLAPDRWRSRPFSDRELHRMEMAAGGACRFGQFGDLHHGEAGGGQYFEALAVVDE